MFATLFSKKGRKVPLNLEHRLMLGIAPDFVLTKASLCLCVTLFYREGRKVPLNLEHRLMLGMAPDYDHLTVIQKVEVFEHALDNSSGQDLHKVCVLCACVCMCVCMCISV